MIDKNNIPVGYKDSPVGIIPQEWEVKTFGEIGIFSKGSGISRSEANTGNIPCVRYGELYTHHHNFIKIYNSFISKEVAANSKLLKYGDILFAATGETKGEIGKSVVFIDKIEAYAGGDIIIVSPDFKLSDSLYMGYLSNSISVIRQKATRGQGDAIVHITSDAIKNILIPLPPLAEQKKIAEILCTWDDAIEKQSKLIEKLELRKRGLMQCLLTGKTRLPGFTEPWKKIKLGDVCCIVTGRLDANAMVSNGEYPFFTCAKEVYKINNYSFDTEALLVSGNGEYVGYVHYYKGKFNAYQRTYVLDGFNCNIFYMYYALKQYLPKRIMRTKSNSNTPYIVKDTLFDMELLLPSDVEQKLIAKLISSTDKEIETQRKKLEALRQQKRGLMQQLLTGKTRVKVS